MTTQAAKPASRIDYLDFIKGIAIIGVILLHTFPSSWLRPMAAMLHIWQAVPLFLFLAGITGCIAWERRKKDFGVYYKDMPLRVWGIYLPYIVAVVLYNLYQREYPGVLPFIQSILFGEVGPGGYFPSLIVQHMLFFPLLLRMRDKVRDDKRFLIYSVLISAAIEWTCAAALAADPERSTFYRFFYGRYLFAAALGAVFYNNENLFSPKTLKNLAIGSIAYMTAVLYFDMTITLLPNAWNAQHYPAYFYTFVMVQWLRNNRRMFGAAFERLISTFGKNSYDIFVTQLFVFSTFGAPMLKSFWGAAALPFICLFGGLGVGYVKNACKNWRKGHKA